MRKHVAVLTFALLCALPATAWAALSNPTPFTITGTTLSLQQAQQMLQEFYPGAPASQAPVLQNQFNSQIAQFDSAFTNQINGLLNSINFAPITAGFANATAAATKSMPVDYASDFSLFTLSAGAGASIHGIPLSTLTGSNANYQPSLQANNQTPDNGLGMNVSLLLGINLGFFHLPEIGVFDLSKLKVYANAFKYDSRKFPSIDNAQVSTLTVGVHAQYQIVDGMSFLPFGLARWGGVNLSTGFTSSSLTINATHDFSNQNQTQQFTYGGKTLQLNYGYTGTADVTVNTSSFAIPIEASTSFQVGYAFTLYGGAGFDLNFGSTSASVTSKAPATLALTDGTVTDTNLINPVASLNFSTPSEAPHVGNARAFGGLQINIVAVGIFAQANIDTSNNWGANFGARAFW